MTTCGLGHLEKINFLEVLYKDVRRFLAVWAKAVKHLKFSKHHNQTAQNVCARVKHFKISLNFALRYDFTNIRPSVLVQINFHSIFYLFFIARYRFVSGLNSWRKPKNYKKQNTLLETEKIIKRFLRKPRWQNKFFKGKYVSQSGYTCQNRFS